MALIGDHIDVEVSWTTTPWDPAPDWETISGVGSDIPTQGVISVSIDGPARTGDHGGQFSPASCTVLVRNRGADFDPEAGTSDYGVANLKRNKKLRVMVNGTEAIFTGYIDDIAPTGTNVDSTATITASDLLRVLSEYQIDALVRPAEFTGERINAILDEIGVPAGERGSMAQGLMWMSADVVSGNALSAMQECARLEQGGLYVLASTGQITFEHRHRWYSDTTYTNQSHSFTADGNSGSSKVFHGDVGRSIGGQRTVTRVLSAGETGQAFVIDETASEELPTTPPYGTTDLPTPFDAMAEASVQAYFEGWQADNIQRFSAFPVRVYPGNANAITAIVADHYRSGRRVELQLKPIGFPSDWNYEGRIEQVTHEIGPDQWDATIRLSPYFTTYTDRASGFWYVYGDTIGSSSRGAP